LVALLIANIPLQLLGTIAFYSAGNWNALAVGLVLLPAVLMIPATIAIAASMINTNVLNLYPGIMQVLSTIQSFNPKGKSIISNQLFWTIALSILGTLMAVVGMINWATSFTSLVSAATGPFAVIIATDLYLIRRFKFNYDSLYNLPKLSSRAGFDIGGVAILLAGALITFYFDGFVTYPINMVPGYLVGGVVTFVLYYAYRKMTGPNGYM
jgi:purine-cytosine permease-like protein